RDRTATDRNRHAQRVRTGRPRVEPVRQVHGPGKIRTVRSGPSAEAHRVTGQPQPGPYSSAPDARRFSSWTRLLLKSDSHTFFENCSLRYVRVTNFLG